MIVDIDFGKECIANRTSRVRDIDSDVWVCKRLNEEEIATYDHYPIYFSSFSDAYRFLYMSEEFKDYFPLHTSFVDNETSKAINLDNTILFRNCIVLVDDDFHLILDSEEDKPIHCLKVVIGGNDYMLLRTNYMYRYSQSEMEIFHPSLQPYYAMDALRKMSDSSICTPDEFDRERTFSDGPGFIIGDPLFHLKFMNNGVRRIIYPDLDDRFPWEENCNDIFKIQMTEVVYK